MPFSYEVSEPEIYEEAKRLFFEEGVKSPSKIRNKLKRKFGKYKATSLRQVQRWCESWKQEDSIASSVDELTTIKSPSDTSENKPLIQDQNAEAVRREYVELIKPPGLPDLIEKGIPGKVAIRLLANWDVAYARPGPLSEWDYSFQTMVFQRAVDIFAEFPDIPYEKAMQLAELEVKADMYDVDLAKEIAQLSRRYRVWKGNENLKAFWEVFNHLHPEVEERSRQKRADRGILSRLLGTNRAKKQLLEYLKQSENQTVEEKNRAAVEWFSRINSQMQEK